jgi:hypothetical protein
MIDLGSLLALLGGFFGIILIICWTVYVSIKKNQLNDSIQLRINNRRIYTIEELRDIERRTQNNILLIQNLPNNIIGETSINRPSNNNIEINNSLNKYKPHILELPQ